MARTIWPHWESRRDRRDPAIIYRWRDPSIGFETLHKMDHHEAAMYEPEHGLHLEPIKATEDVRFFHGEEEPAYYGPLVP